MSGRKRFRSLRGWLAAVVLGSLAVGSTAVGSAAGASEPETALATAPGALAESANPVLLRYLLREDPPGLDEEEAREAVEQLIAAQRADQLRRAEAERREAAAADVIELLGEEEGRAIYATFMTRPKSTAREETGRVSGPSPGRCSDRPRYSFW